MKHIIVTALACLLVTAPLAAADAYDLEAHQLLGALGTKASDLDRILREDLGFRDGIASTLNNRPEAVFQLVGLGAANEDVPSARVFNHFHNPTENNWDHAGLSVAPFARSSVLWQQREQQGGLIPGGGDWAWQDARRYYLDALTKGPRLGTQSREAAFVNTLIGVGHLTHLVQDATVPAHVRDDAHPYFPLGPVKVGFGDGYETWVDRNVNRITGIAAGPTKAGGLQFTPTGRAAAPVPVARIIDTDFFRSTPDPSRLTRTDIGIAEYTHGNFVSDDTIFRIFALPRRESLSADPIEIEEITGERRFYRSKVWGGELVTFFVREGVWDKWLRFRGSIETGDVLDDTIYQEYAGFLLPRAVGYSATLIDYFFRGSLSVDLADDGGDVRMVGTNASEETLGPGSLRVYYDNASGQRQTASEVILVEPVAPGDPLPDVPLTVPADFTQLVAVYQGTLGNEQPGTGGATASPGAVIGRAFNGVRVEEIYVDLGRWMVRTPKGIFFLPWDQNQFSNVRWGDQLNSIVAETYAAEVVAFEVERQADSTDFVTTPTLEGEQIVVSERARATFPVGMSINTTVVISQTVHYRQQLARFTVTSTLEWRPIDEPNTFAYQPVNEEIEPLTFESAVDQSFPFTLSVPLILDASHNRDLSGPGQIALYRWEIDRISVDASGRLLALVPVFLTVPGPEAPHAFVPIYKVSEAGDIVPDDSRLAAVNLTFPSLSGPLLWVLIDIQQGRVVASTATADPNTPLTLTIQSQMHQEGGGWGLAGAPDAEVVAYLHGVQIRTGGGPDDGVIDFGWERVFRNGPGVSTPLGPTSVMSVQAGINQFDQQSAISASAVTIAGYMRDELRQAMTSVGMDGVSVIATAATTNYQFIDTCEPQTGAHCVTAQVNVARKFQQPTAGFAQAHRVPGATGDRLVLNAQQSRPSATRQSTVVSWDASGSQAQVVAPVLAGSYDLVATTDAGSLVGELSFPNADVMASSIVDLRSAASTQRLANTDLRTSYTLLSPKYLYNIEDLKFYSYRPALRATVLPAPLKEIEGNPIGDYHAVPLKAGR